MSLFKLLPFFTITICLIVFTIIYNNYVNQIRINPISNKNDFLNQLQHAFNSSQFKASHISLRTYQNELELNITDSQDESSKILLSTQKDPYWQVASLQEILNKAKIKNRKIKFIDLSIAHPYATFKNN